MFSFSYRSRDFSGNLAAVNWGLGKWKATYNTAGLVFSGWGPASWRQ